MATDSRIHLTRLSYVIYEHPSIETFQEFAKDFGFVETGTDKQDGSIYYRGYGEDPYIYVAKPAQGDGRKRFVGAGFVAGTAEDFAKASNMDGAKLVDMNDRPGGGKSVVLHDPNGFEMVIVWDQQSRTPPPHGVSSLVGQPTVNGALDKRRKGT